MNPGAVEPIGHISPRPRIQIGQPDPRPMNPNIHTPARLLSEEECGRIWGLVKKAAESSNIGDIPSNG